jgi:TetR/AcrR family fatty acid metabolism transcriptional regulator
MSFTTLPRTSTGDKRKLILEAAVKVLARSGFNAATVNEVAQEAGIANGTVYLYFKTKTELFIQTIKDVIKSKLQQISERVESDNDPVGRIKKFIDLHTELVTQNRDVARVMVVEWRKSEEFCLQNPDYNPLNEYMNYLKSLCSAAIESGSIRKVNPQTLAYMILGTMDIVLTQWLTEPEKINLPAITNEVYDILGFGLLLEKQ